MKNKYLLLADGSSPHVLKWIKELVKYFDVYLISLNGVVEEVYDYLEKEQIFILCENVNETGGNYKLVLKIFQIRRIIKKLQPQYLNSHYLSSYGLLGALSKDSSKKMVLIQSTWGSDILVTPFTSTIRKKLAQFTLNKADYISSDSLHMGNVITTLVGEKEIIVFPFGFDTIKICDRKKENIIFSNRALKKFYNVNTILEWFSKQDSKYTLVIANDGSEKEMLQKLCKDLKIEDRVDFVGYLSKDEQVEFYQKSKYYISIPDSDATSVSLLEAMQYGMIPIVSDIPANKEWITDAKNGVFFNTNNKIEEIQIEEDFAKINQNILKDRALFPKSIKDFVTKVTK